MVTKPTTGRRSPLPARTTRIARLFSLLAILSMACGNPAEEHSDGPTASKIAAADVPADLAEQLSVLGYVDYAPTRDASADGVTTYDSARSYPGYNLYVNRTQCTAHLIDARGKSVHGWTGSDCGRWERARLLPNGDLLVVGSDATSATSAPDPLATRHLSRFDWRGERVWRSTFPAHHDVAPLDSGFVSLTMALRQMPEISRDLPIMDNSLARLDDDGVMLETLSLVDSYRAAPESIQFKESKPDRGGRWLSPIHANSVFPMRSPGLAKRHALYAPGNVLVSSRKQDNIAVVSWRSGEVIWSWGQDELSGPHDAEVLENGHFLVLDNGWHRGWSRVVELDPIERKIVWEYRAKDPAVFYTASRGSCQRLPNRNTLIANSDNGIAFEVTREGDIVWEWKNPERDAAGRRATIVRMDRYEEAFVEALLARQR